MASIIKIIRLSKQLPIKPTNPTFMNSVRTAVNNRDWKPGPAPKTNEEKIKAAKKYNLHPDEYSCIPENEPTGIDYIGDYPNLPKIGYDVKDPYYPYDIPHDRRNFNEPVHEDFDDLSGQRMSEAGGREKITNGYAIKVFGTYIGVMVILFWIGEYYPVFPAVTNQQYPTPGEKHYTFDSPK